MNLSKNFRLEEFIKSDTAARNNIDNTPRIEQIENLKHLVVNILQPLRDLVGPIKINSGYRGSALNKFVGGSVGSQHCKGEAADIESASMSTLELARTIRHNFTFDQLILEFYNPDEGLHSGWVHVSYRKDGKNRQEVLTIYKDHEGKTRSKEGML
jgi:hypothetical protein